MEYQTILDKCKKFYREDPSYYHTIRHIVEMFLTYNHYEKEFDEEFKSFENTNDYNKKLIGYAIGYHDAYYLPGFNANEHISAVIADYDLHQELDVLERNIVYDLIESTNYRFPFSSNPSPNKLVLHDLDWYSFVDYDALRLNELLIINEAISLGKYDKNLVIKNRIKFYNKVLEKNLFKTKTFSVYNQKVKENILKRLEKIDQEW